VELPKHVAAHGLDVVNNQNGSFSWSFDSVLHNASQESVYERVAAPSVEDALRGINGTVLMYGQTGSGKTYTTIGDMANFKYRGIVPRALSDVFAYIESHPENDVAVAISYLEIYNDALADLLSSLPSEASVSGDLQICEDGKSGEISVKGQRIVRVASEEAALALLFEGETNRAVASHTLNKHSTRGHAIFTVHLSVRSRVESSGRVLASKLHLVDLAGSERLKKTGTSGERMAESMAINRSLSYLEQLVVALGSKGRSHLPYRQSKLTHLLKDAIGGNCKTALVACIYGEAAHIEETISTLHFASRVSRVRNAVTVNEAQDQGMLLKRYQAEIKQLRQELAMHDSLASRSRVVYDPFTEAQQLALRARLEAFLDGRDVEPPAVESVRMMGELLAQMKVLWAGLRHQLASRPTHAAASAADLLDGGGGGSLRADAAGAAAAADAADAVGSLDISRSAGIAVGHAPDGANPLGGFEMPTRRGRPSSPPGGGGGGGSLSFDDNGFDGGGSSGRGDGRFGGLERNEAFAAFKASKGADDHAQMLALKDAQRQLRAHARAQADAVNGLRDEIEVHGSRLATKREERVRIEARAANARASGDEVIIDEEEYALIKSVKALKAEYRAAHQAFSAAKAELSAVTEVRAGGGEEGSGWLLSRSTCSARAARTRHSCHSSRSSRSSLICALVPACACVFLPAQSIDTLRAAMLSDFNEWFEQQGGDTLDAFRPPPPPRSPGQVRVRTHARAHTHGARARTHAARIVTGRAAGATEGRHARLSRRQKTIVGPCATRAAPPRRARPPPRVASCRQPRASLTHAPSSSAPSARAQDVMDDDEQFDLLEAERVRGAEPDSMAFFNATKSMKKRGKTLRAV
jgi:kinesin family protein 6/9